ncbi:MAG: L,D-transpeptidase [Actinomycetota bacterium]
MHGLPLLRRALSASLACVLALLVSGQAEGQTPSPEPSPTVTASPSPSPSPAPEPAAPSPSPEPAAPGATAPVGPPLPAGSGTGRRIVYSNSLQRVWLVEENEVIVRSYLVSGRRGMPKAGVHRVFSKSPVTQALGGRVSMRYMVRFARGRRLSIGFHSIPVGRRGPIQTEAQLGTFRSHGCVRQRLSDAEALWNFAPIGTTVIVLR